MATDQLIAPLPRLQMEPGFVLALEAIDPATGAAVAGVNITVGTIYGESDDAGELAKLTPGTFMFMPGPGS